MDKRNLYISDGWINAGLLVNSPEPFVVALGGRGIGKTYGILKHLYCNEVPFIYMRRTQTQLDAVTIQPLNPYNQIAADLGEHITAEKLSKHTAGFYRSELGADGELVRDPEPFAIGIALSTFASIRSLSAEKYEVLFFDEIIPERHEKPIKEEGLAFANVLESLNRNREIQGRPPLKVILATNSNTMNSKILDSIGVVDIIDNMTRQGSFYKSVKGLIGIYRYIDSPITEKKRAGALYQVINNRDFTDMALDNEFSRSDYENVQTKPLAEYTPLCSYGNSTIMKHKSKKEYYCITGIKAEHYDKMPLSTKAFQRKYYYVYGAMMDRRVFYQNVSVKMEIEGAFKNA
ncbi:MAG: phage DNA encapsidation protein [Bacteroidales bacterium]|nr:phage DNA encapsidation protein [Bacteroidales bacterium]